MMLSGDNERAKLFAALMEAAAGLEAPFPSQSSSNSPKLNNRPTKTSADVNAVVEIAASTSWEKPDADWSDMESSSAERMGLRIDEAADLTKRAVGSNSVRCWAAFDFTAVAVGPTEEK